MAKDWGRIPSPEEYGEHIARLNAEAIESNRRLSRLEEHYTQLRTDFQAMTTAQTETKTLVGQVISRFDGFEGRILTIFGQMTSDSAKLLQKMTTQNGTTAKGWQKTIVDIVKFTVAALIGYIVSGGGGH